MNLGLLEAPLKSFSNLQPSPIPPLHFSNQQPTVEYDLKNKTGYLSSGLYPLIRILFNFLMAAVAVVALYFMNFYRFLKIATMIHRALLFLPILKCAELIAYQRVLTMVNATGENSVRE